MYSAWTLSKFSYLPFDPKSTHQSLALSSLPYSFTTSFFYVLTPPPPPPLPPPLPPPSPTSRPWLAVSTPLAPAAPAPTALPLHLRHYVNRLEFCALPPPQPNRGPSSSGSGGTTMPPFTMGFGSFAVCRPDAHGKEPFTHGHDRHHRLLPCREATARAPSRSAGHQLSPSSQNLNLKAHRISKVIEKKGKRGEEKKIECKRGENHSTIAIPFHI